MEKEEQDEKESVIKKKGSKNKVVLVIIIILLFLLVLAILAFYNQKFVKDLFSFKGSSKTTVTTKATTTLDTSWYTPTGSAKKLYIYSYDDETSFLTATNAKSIDYYDDVKKIATYNCKYSSCSGYHTTYKYAVVKDGKYYYVYDYIKNKVKEIKIESKYSSVTIAYYRERLYGLLFGNNNLYLFDDDKMHLNSEYDYVYLATGYYGDIMLTKGNINARNVDSYDNDEGSRYTEYIINYKTGKVLLTSSDKDDSNFSAIGNTNAIYYLKNISLEDEPDGYYSGYKIYNGNYKLLFGGKVFYNVGITEAGNLILQNGKAFSTYTPNGKELMTSKEYKSIKLISNKYLIVVDTDNYLKLIDYTGTVIKKLIEYTSNLEYYDTGKYDEGSEKMYYGIEDNSEDAEENYKSYEYNFDTKKISRHKEYYDECCEY